MIGEKPVVLKPFDSPFALSLSKGKRFAQDRLVEGCPGDARVVIRLSYFGLRISDFELGI